MPRPPDEIQVDLVEAQRADGAQVRQQGTVVPPRQDDRQPGLERRVAHHPADVDAARGHGVQHETAEIVVAHFADEGDAQPQPRRAAGENGRRPADRERGVVQDLLHLTIRRRHLAAQHQVGVDVAHDDDVEFPFKMLGHRDSYRFIPDSAIPSTNWRCATKNTTITGRMLTSAPAIIRVHLPAYCVWKSASPTVIVVRLRSAGR